MTTGQGADPLEAASNVDAQDVATHRHVTSDDIIQTQLDRIAEDNKACEQLEAHITSEYKRLKAELEEVNRQNAALAVVRKSIWAKESELRRPR